MLQLCRILKLLNIATKTDALKTSLINQVNLDNICFCYEVLNNCSNSEIKKHVVNYIQKWFCRITEKNIYLDLSFTSIKDLLSDSGLKISSEIEVYNAAERWIKHEPKERIKFAIELIKLVRLPLLSSAVLQSLLKNKNSFLKCLKSKIYIKNVIGKNKNKTFDHFSSCYQNRYYTQDSFHIITQCDNDNHSVEFEIYESQGRTLAKIFDFIDMEIEYMFFIYETFYVLSSRSFKSYSTKTKKWSKSFDYPKNYNYFNYFCSCVFMGHIYILGANTNSWGGRSKKFKSCIVFSPKTEKFKLIAAMSAQREENFACAVFGGKIVISGGTLNNQALNSVEVYDHCAEKWSKMADMLEGRYDHASVSIRNKLYMIGGITKKCEVFDSFSQKFAYIKPILSTYEYLRFKTQFVTTGSKIKIFNKYLLSGAVYDVEHGKWLEMEEQDFEFSIYPELLFFC